jgi:ATP/maltotriose-dependent transcriptional regulator MalT
MKYIILISILFNGLTLWSQDTSPEKQLLEYYNQEEFQLVVEKADSFLQLGEKSNLSRIYQIKADALYFLNDVERSLDNYLLTIDHLDQYPIDTVYLIESYSHTGFCYIYLGKHTKALPYYEKALQICKQINDSSEIANQLSHLGEIYMHLSNYSKAKTYYDQSYQINFALKDTIAFGYDLMDLGDLQFTMREYTKAVKSYKSGIQIRKTRANNHNTFTLRLGKLGHAFHHAGQPDSALHYIDLAIKVAHELNDSLTIAKHWITKAEILSSFKTYDSALWYGNQAKDYFKEEGYNSHKTNVNIIIAEIYQAMKLYGKSKDILLSEMNQLEQLRRWDKLIDVYKTLMDVAEAQGDFKEALIYAKNYNRVNDSILINDKYQTILSLEASFNSKEKEQEIELLQSKDKLAQFTLAQERKNFIALVVLTFLIVFIAVFVYFSFRKKHELQKELLSAQINELRSQLKMLLEENKKGVKIDQEEFNEKLDNPLSHRELDILTYALSDLTNQEIADKVFVSVNTVKFHLKNIYEKIGVTNRKEVIKFALSTSKLNG